MKRTKIKNIHVATYYILFSLCILTFMGCATVSPSLPSGIPGVYHRVEIGQTLWRISKIYNVDLDELAKINHIADATSIEVGQLIFIPHQKKQQPLSNLPSAHFTEDFIWPLRGKVIATFGQTFNNMINKGINIEPYGSPDVVAARSGRVIFYTDNFKGFGKTIIVDHGDGFTSIYARNSQVFIKAGDSVQKGSLIAKAGSAARDKNRYLHFEIRKGYVPQNPYFYLTHR
jgi:murein DD-endopeptidase MepM/ murein hydrolase activator NlpD